jgi:orotate phosphoribosyltransferase
MTEIYRIVEAGKKRKGIESDRGFALAIGIHPQVIADIKAGKSIGNAVSVLKLLEAAGMGVTDGIAAIERQREAGFAEVGVMGAMSLAGVTLLPYEALFTAISTNWTLYIM